MDDLNNDILAHTISDDIFPSSSSFENDDIHQNALSIESSHNDLYNENRIPIDNDLNSRQYWIVDHNHISGEENHLTIHHESTELLEHKSNQISFTGIYNDSEIRHFKDEVSKYQYEVNHLKDELHHHDNMVDLSKGKNDYEFEVSQRNKVASDLNYAIDKLNDAQERLNNAT